MYYKNMYNFIFTLTWLSLIVFCFDNTCALSKFTNVQCNSLDEEFINFSLCRLRAVKRDVNELTIKAQLLQQAKKLVTMRWQLLKKASGYKPFLYDVSADVCEYLEKRNHPFINIILNSFGNYSSILHKCPLENEISLTNFPFPDKALVTLPLPYGEYAIFGTFGVNGTERGVVKVYFMLAEF